MPDVDVFIAELEHELHSKKLRLETLRTKTLALAPVVQNVWNGFGSWKSPAR